MGGDLPSDVAPHQDPLGGHFRALDVDGEPGGPSESARLKEYGNLLLSRWESSKNERNQMPQTENQNDNVKTIVANDHIGNPAPISTRMLGLEMAVEVARVAHEANRAWTGATTGVWGPHWDEATPVIRNSIIDGVQKAVGNPDLTPEDSHVAWTKYKLSEGWTYGPIKDEKTKRHPNLVPYDELPFAEKKKDDLFLGIIRSLT
jgi:hypothetical protein